MYCEALSLAFRLKRQMITLDLEECLPGVHLISPEAVKVHEADPMCLCPSDLVVGSRASVLSCVVAAADLGGKLGAGEPCQILLLALRPNLLVRVHLPHSPK